MNTLASAIEREGIEKDRKRLMTFQEDIKRVAMEYYDELHCDFVCENEELTHEEILLVKRIFDFLKSRA